MENPTPYITIFFINFKGGGFADKKQIPNGQTVRALFNNEVGGDPLGYQIHVNREAVAPEYVLHEGDRVSFTPLKIEGARVTTRERR
jgi:hypothetical protein